MNLVYCSRCGNDQAALFGLKNGISYCRVCVNYQQKEADIKVEISCKNPTLTLPFSLTEEQIKLSNQLLQSQENCYVRAICGAGKTEITYASILQALLENKRVGIAIPRKEIVKELAQRLQECFHGVTITSVYGGHDDKLEGDIVLLTTHQCYRYKGKFGLLIIDEYDAYPFVNNVALHKFARECCYGKSIYLSATFKDEELQDSSYYTLNKRFHNQPLPVPQIVISNRAMALWKITRYLRKQQRNDAVIFLYVPTIQCGYSISTFMKMLRFKHIFFSSKTQDKSVFDRIKNREYPLIITTTILERGITLKNLHVLVYQADHPIFDSKTLIQISGRVGRSRDYSSGDILFFAQKRTVEMDYVIQYTKQINATMSPLQQTI